MRGAKTDCCLTSFAAAAAACPCNIKGFKAQRGTDTFETYSCGYWWWADGIHP